MNANELANDRADILADELLAYHNKGVCGRAAKMLRQQQAEIEALEKQLDTRTRELIGASFYEHDYKTLMAKPPLTDEEIEEVLVRNQDHYTYEIPLYTHPVKELTPCEELRVFQEQQNGVFSEHNACCYRHECRIVWNDWEEIRSNPAELTDEEIEQIASQYLTAHAQFIGAGECHYEGEIEFARAILRKAQEK